MFCPLIKDECKKEACAWWVEGNNNCAITELAEVGITTFKGDDE